MQGERPSSPVFSILGSSLGLAIAELALAIGNPGDLDLAIREAYLTARGVFLSQGLRSEGARRERRRSLTLAALRVVRSWHEDLDDLGSLGEAIADLQDALEACGVRYGAPEDAALPQ